MKIAGVPIGRGSEPYIVAEMSANHNQDLDTALLIIDVAKRCGAHAVKFQMYSAARLAEARGGAAKRLTSGPWSGWTLGALYAKAETPVEWWEHLVNKADEVGLPWFSSVFDARDVGFLEMYGIPAYKISSFDVANIELIREVASTGRPIVMSTGMATDKEIGSAVNVIASHTCEFALLHCVSEYPAEPDQANLWKMDDMRRRYGCPVGWSDHTIGEAVAVAASAMGAAIIEKHLTVTPGMGVDGMFSADPATFSDMAAACRAAWQASQGAKIPGKSLAHLRVVS